MRSADYSDLRLAVRSMLRALVQAHKFAGAPPAHVSAAAWAEVRDGYLEIARRAHADALEVLAAVFPYEEQAVLVGSTPPSVELFDYMWPQGGVA